MAASTNVSLVCALLKGGNGLEVAIVDLRLRVGSQTVYLYSNLASNLRSVNSYTVLSLKRFSFHKMFVIYQGTFIESICTHYHCSYQITP